MIKRATVTTWAEYFEKREGVRIHSATIRNKLKEAGKIGETARNKMGRLFPNAYFSEQDVREACGGLLCSLSQADKNGFANIAGVRHGTAHSFARLLGVSATTIKSRLASSGLVLVRGKGRAGHPADLFPEPAVRELLKDLLGPALIQVGPDGFVDVNGIRHGTRESLARLLGVSRTTIKTHLAESSLYPLSGKLETGRLADLFPEPAVRELLKHLLGPALVRVGPGGCADIASVCHGTMESLARLLGVSVPAIKSRLAPSGLVPAKGRLKEGNLVDLYPEPAVREACKDLIEKRQSAIVNRKSEK